MQKPNRRFNNKNTYAWDVRKCKRYVLKKKTRQNVKWSVLSIIKYQKTYLKETYDDFTANDLE